MSPMEIALQVALLVVLVGLLWWMITRPTFGEMLTAWTERHSEATRNKIADAWVEGHEAGQEYERLRGSRHAGN